MYIKGYDWVSYYRGIEEKYVKNYGFSNSHYLYQTCEKEKTNVTFTPH